MTIRIPWALGLIATHSTKTPILGIDDLVQHNALRVASGQLAYGALETLRSNPNDAAALATFNAHEPDLGYGLLLKTIDPNVTDATPAQIQRRPGRACRRSPPCSGRSGSWSGSASISSRCSR